MIVVYFLLLHFSEIGLFLQIYHWGVVFELGYYLLFLSQFFLEILHSIHHVYVEFAAVSVEILVVHLLFELFSLFIDGFEFPLYFFDPVLAEEDELGRFREFHSLLPEHVIWRKIGGLGISLALSRQPLAQHVDAFEAEGDIPTPNIFDFGSFLHVGYLIVFIQSHLHLLFLKKSIPLVIRGWFLWKRQALRIRG